MLLLIQIILNLHVDLNLVVSIVALVFDINDFLLELIFLAYSLESLLFQRFVFFSFHLNRVVLLSELLY